MLITISDLNLSFFFNKKYSIFIANKRLRQNSGKESSKIGVAISLTKNLPYKNIRITPDFNRKFQREISSKVIPIY